MSGAGQTDGFQSALIPRAGVPCPLPFVGASNTAAVEAAILATGAAADACARVAAARAEAAHAVEALRTLSPVVLPAAQGSGYKRSAPDREAEGADGTPHRRARGGGMKTCDSSNCSFGRTGAITAFTTFRALCSCGQVSGLSVRSRRAWEASPRVPCATLSPRLRESVSHRHGALLLRGGQGGGERCQRRTGQRGA